MKKFIPWKTLTSRIFFDNKPWTTFKHNEFELPSGKRGNYYFVSTRGSSMVIPILEDGNLLLIHQYRYLVNRPSIEFPSGGVKDGQTYEEAAHQELMEEVGYRAKKLEYVGEMIPMNGVTDEISRVYIARDLEAVGQQLEDTEEGAEVYKVTQEQFEQMIAKNEIQDGMTLAAWAMAQSKLYVSSK